jgi:hypothetical protein
VRISLPDRPKGIIPSPYQPVKRAPNWPSVSQAFQNGAGPFLSSAPHCYPRDQRNIAQMGDAGRAVATILG